MGRCEDCGLAYTHPLSAGGHEVSGADSSLTNPDYYDDIVRRYELHSRAAEGKAGRMLDYWMGTIGRRPERILEIGCGTGIYFKGWQKLGIPWVGAEVNPAMIDFCRSRGMPVGPLEDYAGQTFDVVFMSQVFEHILAPRPFLRIIKGFMAGNGIVHMDMPNHASLASLIKRFAGSGYGALEPPHHLIAYSPAVLGWLVREEGFSIVHVGAHANDDPVFGQVGPFPFKSRLQFRAAELVGRGSLLVSVARKPH
jgi:SAM-dependent methyltransferase